jgi:uncharacterized membrane protein
MGKGRLEAFSDGVIAILITLMVLELKIPEGANLHAIRPMLPVFLTYALSFVMLGIYWTNHHHLFHATERVNGAVLWANLHLLFWLSLVTPVTAWMGTNGAEALPTAVYGGVLLLSGVAYYILVQAILREEGPHSTLAQAIGRDVKGKASIWVYLSAIPLAFISPWIADALYVSVAMMWLVPDRRIESRVAPPSAAA